MMRAGRLVATAATLVTFLATLSAPMQAASASGAADRSAPAPITFATYNVVRPIQAAKPWAPRRELAAKLLGKLHADVVGLQESGGPSQWATERVPARDLAKVLGYEWARTGSYSMGRGPRVPGQPRETGGDSYILFRAQRFATGRLGEVVLTRRTGTVESRAAWVELVEKSTGRKVVVVNVHLPNGKTAAWDRVRGKATRILIRKMGQLGLGSTPAVYLGDFNTRRGGAKKDTPTRVFRKAGLQDTVKLAEKKSKAQFNTFNAMRRKAAASGHHLDHIWVPEGTRVTGWNQIARVRNGRYVGKFASDHNPVGATVVLR